MNTYVINLPERTERLAATRKQLDFYGIVHEVIPAIRDTDPAANDGLRKTIVRLLHKAPPGPICVFEDDVVLCPDYLARYVELQPPAGWEMIYLGGMTLADFADGKAKPHAEQVSGRLWWTRETVMTEACLYAAHAREKVIAAIEARPDVPIDVALVDMQRGGNVYACIPRLCWQRGGVSDRAGVYVPGNTDFFTVAGSTNSVVENVTPTIAPLASMST
jgi:GR25 family glycosyltransferase involved in LPS biosynthesis